MGELIMRVCDIFVSPVIRKIWHSFYRQILTICLVLTLILLQCTAIRASDKLSRFEIVSALYERVFNVEATEVKAMKSGLLEPYEDGRYHLDWPVTRGMAANMFYTISVQSGSVTKFPRAFADIRPGSEYYKVLNTVGGAFLPQRDGKFMAENVLNKEDMYRAISVLIDKKVFKQNDLSGTERSVSEDPVATSKSMNFSNTKETKNITSIEEITPFINTENYDHNYTKRAIKKLKSSVHLVKMQQMNPQTMSSIENASQGIKEVKKYMKSMTSSTIDLIEISTKTTEDEKAVEKALSKIDRVLKGMIERFEYSKVQLNNVIPINPIQIKKCSKLNSELTKYIEDAKILRNKISSRLAERR